MRINGEEFPADGKSVEALIEERELKKEMVAVELNERILPREEYGTCIPLEDDVIEIVQFMGGGR